MLFSNLFNRLVLIPDGFKQNFIQLTKFINIGVIEIEILIDPVKFVQHFVDGIFNQIILGIQR